MPHYYSHQHQYNKEIKIINTVIHPDIEYAFYAAPFLILDILKINNLIIKVNELICKPSLRTPHIFTQLPRETFAIEAYSLLPIYATPLSEQLTPMVNNPRQLGEWVISTKH